MRVLVALFVVVIPIFALAQPTANFTADITTGCAPVIVHFTDLSQGAVLWEWDTGAGNSTQKNPSMLYLNSGSYTVRLIVTDASGRKDTLTKTQYIEVHDYPDAQLQASSVNICAHEPITFTDLSSTGSGNIVSWQWDFGDGNISSLANPLHTYREAGTYPISLVVENQYGCQDEVILANYISVQAPDPAFSADEKVACGPPLQVTFTPANTSGTHVWDFGDGNSSNAAISQNTYTQYGTFDVRHIAVDSRGCRDTLTKRDHISLGINTLSISARDSSVCIYDTVFFQSNAPSNSLIQWDFGNGDSAFEASPSYIYTNPGTYMATAFISDSGGCQVSLQVSIQVFGKPQIDIATLDTTVGCALPFRVDFINQTQGGTSYIWKFGDGSPISNQVNPSHTYTREDTFSIYLRAEGPGGCIASKTFTDYVLVKKLEAGFESDLNSGCAPLAVQFTDTTLSPFPISSWTWSFGNGTSSGAQHPNVNFNGAGNFDISLIVQNTQGCKDTAFRPGYIQAGLKPVVDFVIDTNKACAYGPATFTNLSSGASDFIWFFSDGDTAMSYNALHGFGALGMMDVMLVGNDRGCRDTMVQTDIIEILAPLPIMGISDRTICDVPQTVYFNDLSIGADRTSWYLNNSFVTNQRNWTHSFSQDGYYPISMTVTNDSTGCVITSGNGVTVKQVKAEFVPDTNRSCVPFRVNFLDQSVNAIKWNWHFGYGTDSAQVQNPSFNYPETGVFNPYVVVTNSINCKDTFQYNSIHALGVDAQFRIASDSVGCVPLDVQFESLSTSTGSISSWEWDMGDSSTYQTSNPLHTFTAQDFYSIKLKVTDQDGCVDSVSKGNKIYATQPIPNFLINPPVNCSDKEIVFVSLSSGAGLTYTWDFGDGNSSTRANPNYSYTNNGTYSVELTVTDVNGCDSSMTKTNSVLISDLYAAFTADTTFAACPPLTVNFAADTAFPHADITYIWDFGDGATSREPIPSHIYTLPGQYTVSLIVKTPAGCSDTMVMDQLVQVLGPTANININPSEACPGEPIDFEATSTFQVSYDWIFGDGFTAPGQQVSYAYNAPGTYRPVLAIKDSAGCEVYHVSPQDITVHTPPVADFLVSDTSLCDSGMVSLTPQTQQTAPISNYWWEVENGAASTLQAPSFHFGQTGPYNIRLEIEDQHGCRDTLTKEGIIEVYPSPDIDILLTDSSGCVPFGISATIDLQGHPYPLDEYQWLSPYANGSESSLSFTVIDSGLHRISLSVSDQNHCVDSTERLIIANPTPKAGFGASDSFGCSPFLTLFENRSTGPTVKWRWNFGDGGSSNLEMPSYNYQSDGIYTVGLWVENSYGCSDSTVKQDYINLRHPVADFAIDPNGLCPNEPLVFQNNSQSDTLWAGFSWNFGDGNSSSESSPGHIYTQSGMYDVQLIATDTFQCSDTLVIQEAVEVFEDIIPETVAIQSVSVIDNRSISIEFETFPNTRGDFGSYQVMRMESTGEYETIAVIEDLQQSSYVDLLPDERLRQQSQCYKIMVVNHCGTAYPLDQVEAHCSINLQTEAGDEQVLINWSPYIGWSSIRSYQLFRVNNYDPTDMVLLADFDENNREYLDLDMHCYDTYSYRVLATGPRPGLKSFSDTAFAAPTHLTPTEPTHILRVSVENDEFVQIDWELPEIENAVGVVLERNDGSGFEPFFEEDFQNSNKKFQDKSADVHGQSYYYRAFTVDSCGDYTPAGHSGNSIHLRTRQEGAKVELSWNAYKGWPQGVEAYRIEILDPNTNSYQVVARVSGGDTSYVHQNANKSGFENCYHIIAEAAHSDETYSLSNKECQWMDPVMYYPNAFTPNGDGVNEVFLPQGYYLENYYLTVFDRWGKILFESKTLTDGWNGMRKNGEEAPEGVYVFQVTGMGKNGVSFKRTGTVSLLR